MRVKHALVLLALVLVLLVFVVAPSSSTPDQDSGRYLQRAQSSVAEPTEPQHEEELVPLHYLNGERVFKEPRKTPVDCAGSADFCANMQQEAQREDREEIDKLTAQFKGMSWQKFQELEIAEVLKSADIRVAIKYSYSDTSRKVKVGNLVRSVRRWHKSICIIVVDDYLGNDSVPTDIMDFVPNLMYVKVAQNVGLSMGRNLLVHLTKTPYMFTTDDDMRFPSGDDGGTVLRRLRTALEADRSLALAGGMFRYVDVVANLFLARTEVLRQHPWAHPMRLLEHEFFFASLWYAKFQDGGSAIAPEESSAGPGEALRVAQCDSVVLEHDCGGRTKEYIKHRRGVARYAGYFCEYLPWISSLSSPYSVWDCAGRKYKTDPDADHEYKI